MTQQAQQGRVTNPEYNAHMPWHAGLPHVPYELTAWPYLKHPPQVSVGLATGPCPEFSCIRPIRCCEVCRVKAFEVQRYGVR